MPACCPLFYGPPGRMVMIGIDCQFRDAYKYLKHNIFLSTAGESHLHFLKAQVSAKYDV